MKIRGSISPVRKINTSNVSKMAKVAKTGIHINPKNKGKFNALKKKTGKSTEELTHSKNPLTRKRAIFAQNAKKWHHKNGGEVPCEECGGKLQLGGAVDNPTGYYENGGKYNWEVTPRMSMEVGGQIEMAKDGKWIQKAVNPKHKGYCTPMTKSTWEIDEDDLPIAGDGNTISNELKTKSGNPQVTIDSANPRSYYDPVTNSINATTQDEVLSEYPHAIQNQNNELTTQNELAIRPSIISTPEVKQAYYDRRSSEMENINNNFDAINNSTFYRNTKSITPFLNNDVRMHYVDQMQYSLPGTAEYDAHQEIEPEIRFEEYKKTHKLSNPGLPILPKRQSGGITSPPLFTYGEAMMDNNARDYIQQPNGWFRRNVREIIAPHYGPTTLAPLPLDTINPIPFKEGSYFTRDKQQGEIGGKEYFDKTTGRKLMKLGGKIRKSAKNSVSWSIEDE